MFSIGKFSVIISFTSSGYFKYPTKPISKYIVVTADMPLFMTPHVPRKCVGFFILFSSGIICNQITKWLHGKYKLYIWSATKWKREKKRGKKRKKKPEYLPPLRIPLQISQYWRTWVILRVKPLVVSLMDSAILHRRRRWNTP